MSEVRKLLGKFRGTVINTVDPMMMGRIQAIVPDSGTLVPTSWAMPCVPIAGVQSGAFMIPQIGSNVWIEFEQGNPDYPIWCGGFWGSAADVPALAQVPPAPLQNIGFQTFAGQHLMMVSDAPPTPVTGGIVLKSLTGAMIVVNDSGIYINNGKGACITLIGPVVDVNLGALTVT